MVKMIATKVQTYGRKTVEAGEEFEVEDAYVPTLISLGRASVKGAKAEKPKPQTTKPAEPAEPDEKPAPKAPVAEVSKPAPTYRTRDLKAHK